MQEIFMARDDLGRWVPDVSLHRGVADGHLAALIEVACRRALEAILLEDVEVEVTTPNRLPQIWESGSERRQPHSIDPSLRE
jgi:hypothetical protein